MIVQVNRMKCVCIVLNYNDATTVIEFANKVKQYRSVDKIVIVDNNSTDNSYSTLKSKYVKEDKIVVIKTDVNKGYGYGNNFGLKYAKEKYHNQYTLISNPDVIFSDSMLEELLAVIQKKQVAVVSGVQTTTDKTPIADKAWKVPTAFEYIFANTRLGHWLNLTSRYPNDYFDTELSTVDCVPGAMLLVDTDAFLDVGGYDERMFLYGEETTLGFKLKQKGYVSLLANNAQYVHIGSTSTSKSLTSKAAKQQKIYQSRLFFLKHYLKVGKLRYIIAKKVYDRSVKKISQVK